jgi:hypothetical protein
VTGGWRKLFNEVLRNLYCSQNIRVNKSVKIREGGYIAAMGKRGVLKKLGMKSPKEKTTSEVQK